MSSVLVEKLPVAQLLKNFATFFRREGLLPWSQEPATDPYPEPDKTNPYHPSLFL
jgi:hypothetical protein